MTHYSYQIEFDSNTFTDAASVKEGIMDSIDDLCNNYTTNLKVTGGAVEEPSISISASQARKLFELKQKEKHESERADFLNKVYSGIKDRVVKGYCSLYIKPTYYDSVIIWNSFIPSCCHNPIITIVDEKLSDDSPLKVLIKQGFEIQYNYNTNELYIKF